MIAIDVRQPWKYVLKRDRKLPEGERTVFHLRPLSVGERWRLFSDIERLPGGQQVRRDLGPSMLRSLRYGLVGWDRMKAQDGGEVPFRIAEDGLIGEDSLARLDMAAGLELATAIERELDASEEDLGKSEPPSSSPSTGT